MEEFFTSQAVSVAVAAFGIALGIERFTEIVLNIVFALVNDFRSAWSEKMSGSVKMLLTFLFNGGLYAIFFRWDFVSPLMESLDIVVQGWQGTTFSVLVIAGGSQFVHQFFGFFGRKPEPPE